MKVVSTSEKPDKHALFYSEWLITNGLGGYASSSLSFAPMRKYHALLMAALPAPFGRTVMLNHVADAIVLPDKTEIPLSLLNTKEKPLEGAFSLSEFHLENGAPIWIYEKDGIVLRKSLLFVHRQNTLHVIYRLLSSKVENLALRWRPYLNFRTHEEAVNAESALEISFHSSDHHYEITTEKFPTLRFFCQEGASFTNDAHLIENVIYEVEGNLGYASIGKLKSPGYFLAPLHLNEKMTFTASCEPWTSIHALSDLEAEIVERLRRNNILRVSGSLSKSPITSKLVLAADQFIMTPMTRRDDMVRLQAAGEDVKSIIAGFPWFTDWGRDTMISLEGLVLITGRLHFADAILRTFSYYIKDGLIPNMFPDGETEALYNTADASLWYFHAVDRYIHYSGNNDILEILLPKLRYIIDSHLKGTLFGIKVDEDGLLMQGQKGVQLTWMDAKVGDWVVTPRRGKAVEINALWYNALRLLEEWTGKSLEVTEKCRVSFNRRFWNEKGRYLYDVIDGENLKEDDALRPNQIFSFSLKYPVLEEKYWKFVLDITQKELLTPVGLRTLAPNHPDYKPTYDGDLRARDAAYHQGTVWPWLIGPFIDAWLKVYPGDFDRAHQFLKGLEEHLDTGTCIGTITEIFDATPPYKPRGCFAQAWSVAEFLRVYVKTSPDFLK